MSDDRVLERVEVLVARSNQLTAELLAYLAEVDARGLHLREATGSLFAFCVERLHMSESAAGKRITAARTARRFPPVLAMIARGELHLTAVTLLAPHLTEENSVELLARARHKSKRAIENLIAEMAPRPDVPSRVVALPRRPVETAAEATRRSAPLGAPNEHAPERVAPAPGRSAATVAQLSPRRYQIRVTVGEETHAALCQLQNLLSHQVPDRDPAVIVARALELLLERTLARKVGATDRRASRRRRSGAPGTSRLRSAERSGGGTGGSARLSTDRTGAARRPGFSSFTTARTGPAAASTTPTRWSYGVARTTSIRRCSITAPSSWRRAGGARRRGRRSRIAAIESGRLELPTAAAPD